MKFLLLTLLFSWQLHAASQTHEVETNKFVTLEVPAGWETVKDLFGIPLAVLGPWNDESRPVLSILFTHLTREKFAQKDFQNLFADFKNEKDAWVKSHQGTLISYEPATPVDFGKDLSGHYIGLEFEMNSIHFIERSYYLYCKNEVYNLKYSLRDEHRQHLAQLQKLVREFKCK